MEWSLALSGLALLVSLGTVFYVQWRLDRRERAKWHRETLTRATFDFYKEARLFEALVESLIYESTDANQEELGRKIDQQYKNFEQYLFIMEAVDSKETFKLAEKVADYYSTNILNLKLFAAKSNKTEDEMHSINDDFFAGRPKIHNLKACLDLELA